MFRPLVVTLLAASIAAIGCQKRAAAPPFDGSPVQMAAELNLLRSALEEGHPGLYRYAPRESLEAAFAGAQRDISRPLSALEYRLVVCRLVARIRDGHTAVLLPRDTLDRLDGGVTALPFRVAVVGDSLYVRNNLGDLAEPEFLHARLLAINGHPTEEILRTMHAIIPADGRNETRWRRVLESLRLSTRYLAIAYGVRESYEVRYVAPGEDTARTATLRALPYDEAVRRLETRYPRDARRPPAEWTWLPDSSIAVLRIGTFDKDLFRDAKMDAPRFLEATFRALNQRPARGLILDLRNNRGGTDEYGERVAAHLVDHDFTYYASLRMNKTRYDFFAHTTNARGFSAPRGFARRNAAGGFDVVQHPNLGTRHPARDVYRGPLAVLIDGASFSTTSELLSVLACNTKAVFVGEESGGAFGGNCSGPTPTLELPHSRIRVDIPLVRYDMAVTGSRPRDRGILPDIVVQRPWDALHGEDPALDAAARWIRESRVPR